MSGTEVVVGRRDLSPLLPIVMAGILISACSSSSAPSAKLGASPRSVCSLLTAQEAAKALGGPVQGPSECATSPGDQSSGLYFYSGRGPLLIHVGWAARTVSTFTGAHGAHVHYIDGMAPVHYQEVTVARVPAYWQVSPPPGPGNRYQSLTSMKTGYVVTLTSMGIAQPQVERALAVVLNHL